MQGFLDSLDFRDLHSRSLFESKMMELDAIPDSFSCAFEVGFNSRFVHFSGKVEKCLGWPASHFLDDVNFMSMRSLTPDRFLTYVSRKQKEYVDEGQQPGFDYRAPQIMTFRAALYNTDENEVPIVHYSVPLTYTNVGVYRTVIGINLMTNVDAAELSINESISKQLLIEAKKIFVEAFPEKFENINPIPQLPTMIYHPRGEMFKEPSEKEKTVLTLLARGMSTKEIGSQLGITPNTVETHRKHLLEKFDAKNTAELIQKASKVYWLE